MSTNEDFNQEYNPFGNMNEQYELYDYTSQLNTPQHTSNPYEINYITDLNFSLPENTTNFDKKSSSLFSEKSLNTISTLPTIFSYMTNETIINEAKEARQQLQQQSKNNISGKSTSHSNPNNNRKTNYNRNRNSNNSNKAIFKNSRFPLLENPNSKFTVLKYYKKGKWTKDEDSNLKELVERYEQKNWRMISKSMAGRSPIQCLHRWCKILKPGLVKGTWTIEEDMKLQFIVQQFGENFGDASKYIPGRTNKQCRERWLNVLNPQVTKGSWTINEDYLVFKLHKNFGGKWISFVPFFKARAENSIKNRFYSTTRRYATLVKKEKEINIENLTSEELNDKLFNEIKIRFMSENGLNNEEEVKEFEENVLKYNGKIVQPKTDFFSGYNKNKIPNNNNTSKDASTASNSINIQPINISNIPNINIESNNFNLKRNFLYCKEEELKNADLKIIEKEIYNMCDNPGNMLNTITLNNNIGITEITGYEDLNIKTINSELDSLLGNITNTNNGNNSNSTNILSIMSQLNDLEALVAKTKYQLIDYIPNIDNNKPQASLFDIEM